MNPSADTMTGQPLGAEVDATPAERPGTIRLDGRFCRIETLDPALHGDGLWQSCKEDRSIWTYLAYGPFADERSFAAWLDERAVLLDPFSYAVVDLATGLASGIVTLMEIRPAMRVIEIGNIVYGRPLQRTCAATEAQYLMAQYAFEWLGYRRYEWKCNALNAPSRQAALRLGFAFEGVFRQHMIVKGRNRDTAWYAMLDGEWPERKAAFERWLAPENFDESGRQRVSLSSLNAAGART
jgi:RimJ/RimL family protein N-acetyltransferase